MGNKESNLYGNEYLEGYGDISEEMKEKYKEKYRERYRERERDRDRSGSLNITTGKKPFKMKRSSTRFSVIKVEKTNDFGSIFDANDLEMDAETHKIKPFFSSSSKVEGSTDFSGNKLPQENSSDDVNISNSRIKNDTSSIGGSSVLKKSNTDDNNETQPYEPQNNIDIQLEKFMVKDTIIIIISIILLVLLKLIN